MMRVFNDNYKLNLGELQSELKALSFPKTNNFKVRLSNGNYLTNEWGSHRGNYHDMYISDYGKDHLTLEGLLSLINEALHEGVMTGYKGGEFVVNKDTYVGFTMYGCGGGTWPFAVVVYKEEIIIIVDEF